MQSFVFAPDFRHQRGHFSFCSFQNFVSLVGHKAIYFVIDVVVEFDVSDTISSRIPSLLSSLRKRPLPNELRDFEYNQGFYRFRFCTSHKNGTQYDNGSCPYLCPSNISSPEGFACQSGMIANQSRLVETNVQDLPHCILLPACSTQTFGHH